MSKKNATVVFWGTCDTGKPRVRLLLQGLKEQDITVLECRREIWQGVEDKSQLSGWLPNLARGFRLAMAYPGLIIRYLRLPRHNALICSYPGAVDLLIIFCFARLRRVPLIWDMFISIYDTVVVDRKLISHRSPAARLLYGLEWLACRAADCLLMDTKTHAAAMEKLFNLPSGSIGAVPVGCESSIFKPLDTPRPSDGIFRILFYGQFIPLHGIDIIIKAMKRLQDLKEPVQCTIIGTGQEQSRMDSLLADLKLDNVKRIHWVPYEELPQYIHEADVCLGIFREQGNSARVVPNKAYQVLAMNKPLITGDTPAAREILADLPQVFLIPPEDPKALADSILRIRDGYKSGKLSMDSKPYILDAHSVGKKFLDKIEKVSKQKT